MNRSTIVVSLAAERVAPGEVLSRVEWIAATRRAVSAARRKLEEWLRGRDPNYVLLPQESDVSSPSTLILESRIEVIRTLRDPETRPLWVAAVCEEDEFEVEVPDCGDESAAPRDAGEWSD